MNIDIANLVELGKVDATPAPATAPTQLADLLTITDLMATDITIHWVIDGLLADASLTMWTGDAGGKKTWTLLDMAVCVANGKQWLGRATRATPVLIIDEESGRRRLSQRLRATMQGHNVSPDNTPIYALCHTGTNLRGNDSQCDDLIATAKHIKAGLIIIDAFADVMAGGDENSVKDTLPVAQSMARIARETGAAVICIHHASKSGGYRGSSAIKGAVDNLIMSECDGDNLTIKPLKMRDGEIPQLSVIANFVGGAFWLAVDDTPPAKQSQLPTKAQLARDAIADWLPDNPDGTYSEMIRALKSASLPESTLSYEWAKIKKETKKP